MRSTYALATLLCSALIAGCGDGERRSDTDRITTTIRTYLGAQVSGDGERACAQLTAAGQRKLVALTTREAKGLAVSLSCPDAVRLIRTFAGSEIMVALAHARATGVRVTGARASAALIAAEPVGRRRVLLEKVGSAWKIAEVPSLR